VVEWLHPDWRFVFERQVPQTHRTHGRQGIIFADATQLAQSFLSGLVEELAVITPFEDFNQLILQMYTHIRA